jgi:hypothetical protein
MIRVSVLGPIGLSREELRIEDLQRAVREIQEEFDAMTPAEQEAAEAEAHRALAADDDEGEDVWGIDEMFTELRWNHDANGSVSGEALEAFAQLTRRPDLIAEAKLTPAEYHALTIARGGLWPLEGTDWRERQMARFT